MWNFVFSGIEKYYNLKHAPFSGFTFDQTSLYECLAFKKSMKIQNDHILYVTCWELYWTWKWLATIAR